MKKRMSYLGIVAITLVALLGIVRTGHTARKPAAEVKIVSDDIGGVVTSSKGPEAGVWVIAETKDLPTGYRKNRGHRRSGPLRHSRNFPKRITTSGCAATAWWILRK